MGRGGARVGAGRPKTNTVERAEVILSDLLIPAFKAAKQGLVFVGEETIRLAYGLQGLREWNTWFEMERVGVGINRGHTTTSWRLRMKLTIAAYRLLKGVDEDKLLWPTEAIKAVMNKKAYDRWVAEYTREMKVLAAEYGHREVPPPAFNPTRNYIKTERKAQDGNPKAPISVCTRGYLEMVTGGNNGYETPYTGYTPDASDVPY